MFLSPLWLMSPSPQGVRWIVHACKSEINDDLGKLVPQDYHSPALTTPYSMRLFFSQLCCVRIPDLSFTSWFFSRAALSFHIQRYFSRSLLSSDTFSLLSFGGYLSYPCKKLLLIQPLLLLMRGVETDDVCVPFSIRISVPMSAFCISFLFIVIVAYRYLDFSHPPCICPSFYTPPSVPFICPCACMFVSTFVRTCAFVRLFILFICQFLIASKRDYSNVTLACTSHRSIVTQWLLIPSLFPLIIFTLMATPSLNKNTNIIPPSSPPVHLFMVFVDSLIQRMTTLF